MSTITTTTAPQTACQPWCRHDDPLNHFNDEGEPIGHSVVLAEGADCHHYGPIYTVSLQHTDDDAVTRLFVTIETATLTADQAEVLGRALLEGAAGLRASGDTAAADNICGGYMYTTGWVDVPPTVFQPTPAETALHQG